MDLSLGILTGLITMFAWGVADFFAAFASRKIGHFRTLLWVYIVAFLLASVYLIFNPQTPRLSRETLIVLALIGFLQATALMCFYRGLEMGLISVVSPIASSYAWIVVLLGIFCLKEKLMMTQLLSISLIFIGVPLVCLKIDEIKKAKGQIFRQGTRESFIAMVFWGVSYFLLAPVVRENGWFFPTYISLFCIIVCLLTWGILLRKKILIGERNVLFPVLADGFLTIIGMIAFSLGLMNSFVSIVTPISTAFPAVTVILAIIFFKEKLAWNQIFGIIGVITGLFLLGI